MQAHLENTINSILKEKKMENLVQMVNTELNKNREFFNSIIGVLSFSFGLACLSMPSIDTAFISSTASVIMIILMLRYNSPKHSPTLNLLRNKSNKNRIEEESLDVIENELFKTKHYLPSDFGFIFLMSIFLYNLSNFIEFPSIIKKLT